MREILFLAAICSFFYGGIVWRANSGTLFFLFWFLTGAVFAGISAGLSAGMLQKLPGGLRLFFAGITAAGMVVFLAVELCVLSGFRAKTEPEVQFLIVLGAQVRESGPTRSLKYRLDKACTYLMAHPETICIVSGGQGRNEPDSEAQVMYTYLVQKGIDGERILREDQSVNTMENLRNSSAFLDKVKDRVGIVTSDFHVFRAMHLARGQGYKQISGIPAPSSGLYLLNNMVREFFGVGKDFLMGHLA